MDSLNVSIGGDLKRSFSQNFLQLMIMLIDVQLSDPSKKSPKECPFCANSHVEHFQEKICLKGVTCLVLPAFFKVPIV